VVWSVVFFFSFFSFLSQVQYEHEEPWGVVQGLEAARRYHAWVVPDAKAQGRF
jgi:hypothetical protein